MQKVTKLMKQFSEEFKDIASPRDINSLNNFSEILDMDYLKAIDFYQTNNCEEIGKQMYVSETISYHIIKDIIEKGKELVYENELEKKKPRHASYNTVVFLNRTVCIALQPRPTEVQAIELDTEPPVVSIDSWLRSKMQVERVSKFDEFNADLAVSYPSVYKGLSKKFTSSQINSSFHSEMKSKKKHQVKEDPCPPALNLADPIVIDKIEDKLRKIKENEVRLKEEILLKETLREKVILQKQIKESKAKNFTYNFEGNGIIFVHNVKKDNFPPQTYPINALIMEEKINDDEKKSKKIEKKDSHPKKKQVRKKTIVDNLFLREDKPILEEMVNKMALKPGVSLVFNGHTRTEQKNYISRLEELSENNIHLSKTEYLNVQSETMPKTSSSARGIVSAGDMGFGRFRELPLGIIDEKSKTDGFRDEKLNTLKNYSLKKGYQKLKINSDKLFDSMTNTISEYDEMKEQETNTIVEEKRFKTEEDSEKQLSVFDNFNLTLDKQKTWGTLTMGTKFLPNLDKKPKGKGNKSFQIKRNKNQKLQLEKIIKTERMPLSKMNKTVGNKGFLSNKGFFPQELTKIIE